MAYKSGVCYACGKRRPVESHHTFPLELGGEKDGEQVLICADCHNVIHAEAKVYSKTGKFQDLDFTIPYMPDPNSHGYKIRMLIAKIVKAMQLHASGEIGAGDQRRMTQISWDNDQELLIAHEVKKMLKFKSLERVIKKLVFDYYMTNK